MRLAAQAKMGFYPTPINVTEMIKNHLRRNGQGVIRIFDPCAGEGTALEAIGNHLKAQTYGIEIDVLRGNLAKKCLTKTLITDYQNVKITKKSFSLLWLNPPYDWSAKPGELEKSERYERIFLRNTIEYLCDGGILVYLIPQGRLDDYIAKILGYRFEKLRIFKFPESEYQAFKQLVIFGRLKKTPLTDDQTIHYLKESGKKKSIIPYLLETPQEVYDLPLSPSKKFVFLSKTIDPEELAHEIQAYGLFHDFKEKITPLRLTEKIRPIMRLRYGHLAQIIACGLTNGVVWDQAHQNPLLVKGTTRKEVVHSVEIDEDKERHIERDLIKPSIRAFDIEGNLFTIE